MRKFLLTSIMFLTAIAVYAPVSQQDPAVKFESWLSSSSFSPESLMLAIEFNELISPDVIMCQSRLETGNFQSQLFTMHNNLFGMKLARRRATTALGATDNDYATYCTWYDSVKDMKLFQEWYLGRGRDLSDYFAFLASIGYAEDPLYLVKLRKICTM